MKKKIKLKIKVVISKKDHNHIVLFWMLKLSNFDMVDKFTGCDDGIRTFEVIEI